MTDGDLLGEAVAELYSSDPDEFVERRGALVARGREAGQAPAAKQIAALRKPTTVPTTAAPYPSLAGRHRH